MKFIRKVKHYIQESYLELTQKVSWPTWTDLQGSAIIVMVASVIFALVVLLMDIVFKYGVNVIYSIFS
jgi:preprotein translocase subunit SecE